MFLKHTTGW